MNPLKNLYSKMKYGKPIIIVSGLPRSGTSMMMKMLEAGGAQILTDGLRTPDEDNPKGYYELERVKDLDKTTDKSWLEGAKGAVVKVISLLLKDLPPQFNYKVIFMLRDLEEVIASQNKMLIHRGQPVDHVHDAKMILNYEKHLREVKYFMSRQPNFDVLYVEYKEAVRDPAGQAQRVNRFLGNQLDTQRMAQVADSQLYRNRKEAAGDS